MRREIWGVFEERVRGFSVCVQVCDSEGKAKEWASEKEKEIRSAMGSEYVVKLLNKQPE